MSGVIHPFNPGDYVIDWSPFGRIIRPPNNIISHLKDSIDESIYWSPSDDTYVHQLPIYEICTIYMGHYYVKDIFSKKIFIKENLDSYADYAKIRHNKDRIWKLDKKYIQHLMIKYPLKASLDDKITNPYLLMSDDEIKQYNEYIYGLDINLDGVGRKISITEENRAYFAKSLPFLNIIDSNTYINYNVKYKKFLGFLEHKYTVCKNNEEIEIKGTINDNHLNFYKPFNNIWSEVCTSPSQVILSTLDIVVDTVSIAGKS